MIDKKEMTAPNVSVGADTEQSIQKCTDNSITDNNENFKGLDESFREMQREMLRQMDPSYLKTVSMSALYDTDFEAQESLVDELLYRGTYLFAGSPKVGKSFMMAQLAYHISTGTPLWNYRVRKATVLYFALEDDYPRLQRRLYQMFGADGTDNLYFATQCSIDLHGISTMAAVRNLAAIFVNQLTLSIICFIISIKQWYMEALYDYFRTNPSVVCEDRD